MSFINPKSVEKSFQYIRLFTGLIVVLSFLLCAFCIVRALKIASVTQNRIYVLSNGKVLEAFASEKKDNIPVEARDHIRVFHQLFFTLDPDEKVITSNMTRALYLADESAKREYENLKESGYYANVISGNISQEISVDSIALNTSQYPFFFRCYATERIIRSTNQVIRTLITEGTLRNTSRSDNNSHGFLIERWSIIQNADSKSLNR